MTKYYYGEHEGWKYRICLNRYNDSDFGIIIRYVIEDAVPIPRNFWEKIKQFFTVKNYSLGYWYPTIETENDIFDELSKEIIAIARQKNALKKAEQMWNNLK